MTASEIVHTKKILQEVRQERAMQTIVHGQQNRPPAQYAIILHEEVGEVSKEICEIEFSDDPAYRHERMIALRNELIQIAAVAVAMVECLDRNELKPTTDNCLVGDEQNTDGQC